MRKSGTKECTINPVKSAAWRRVDVKTIRTEELDGIKTREIRSAAWQCELRIAKYARTNAEVTLLKLFYHLLHALPSNNVALMDKAVKKFSR